jgi:hypothetical protein
MLLNLIAKTHAHFYELLDRAKVFNKLSIGYSAKYVNYRNIAELCERTLRNCRRNVIELLVEKSNR